MQDLGFRVWGLGLQAWGLRSSGHYDSLCMSNVSFVILKGVINMIFLGPEKS